MSLDAVVLAAGEGRRLRPLTERWPKPVLPIDGRPVIATLLEELARIELDSVTVVTGHLAEQVEELLGDGAAFGLAIRFVRQAKPLGSADALRHALAGGAGAPLLVVAADTVFGTGALERAVSAWAESGAPAGLGVRDSDDPDKTPVRAEGGRVLAIGGEGGTAAAPLWFFGEPLLLYLEQTSGPPFELAAAARSALAEGIEIAALEVGPTRDLTRPVDVMVENFPYLSKIG